jgi:hypothetical protein
MNMMTATGEPTQHGAGVLKMKGLPQELPIEFNDRITAKDEVLQTNLGDAAGLFTSEVLGLFKRQPSLHRMLRELGCAYFEINTEQGKKFLTPR